MGCGNQKSKSGSLEKTKLIYTNSIFTLQKIHSSIKKLSTRKNRILPGLLVEREESIENIELSSGVLIDRPKTNTEIAELRLILVNHVLFNSIPLKIVNEFIKKFTMYAIEPNALVFTQGSLGEYFYIVNTGSVEVIINKIKKSVITKGGYFGEIALLHNTSRTATIRTLEPTTLWVLSRESFKFALKSITTAKYLENKKFLDNISLFQVLNKQQKETLLGLLVSQDFMPEDKIINEGDPGEIFYVIRKGIVSCSIKGTELRRLTVGDFFGEQALIHSTQRTATVTAVTKVSLLSLRAESLISLIGARFQDIIYKNSIFISIEKSPVLKYLTKDQIEACISYIKIQSYSKDQIVFRKGQAKANKLGILLKGQLKSNNSVLTLFSCIGDVELAQGKSASVVFDDDWIANTDTDIGFIELEELNKSIGCEINEIIIYNDLLNLIKKINLFRNLPLSKLKSLISVLKVIEFKDNQAIFEQGDLGNSFFIVKEGSVHILKDGVLLRVISQGDYFGEKSIILQEKRSATAVSKGKTSCWVLTKLDFLNLIDENMKKQLMKKIELQNDSISLADLDIIQLIGKGMFGKVFLVQDNSERFYALKSIERWKIRRYDLYKDVTLERKILLKLDHPMIMKLVKTFKDESRIYFLTEYVQGSELFEVIRSVHKIDEEDCAFYIGCLLLVLKCLSERSIVHRDLKPENIIIDEDGYIKLIDFGAATIVNNRTYTVMGTPHYMAPEVIKGTGHSFEADYWSLGIMLYEFLFYVVPFAENETDTFLIYKSIQESQVPYPDTYIAPECKDLINKLLSKTPHMRGNIDSITTHPFFNETDWEKLFSKQIPAPYKPKIENPIKTVIKDKSSNFYKKISEFEELPEKNDKQGISIPSLDWDQEF